MGSAVASLLLVAFPSPPHSRRGAGEAGGVVVYHRVGPPRRFAPPLLVQGGDRKLMNCSHLFTLSAPRPSLRACRAPSRRSLRRRRWCARRPSDTCPTRRAAGPGGSGAATCPRRGR